MEDLDAASVEDVSAFFRTYYAPNNAVLSIVGDVDPAAVRRWTERYFGGDPRQPVDPAARRHCRLPPILGEERREIVHDRVPLPRDLLRLPRPAVSATSGSTRSTSPPRSSPAARAAGSTAGSCATSGSPRTSSLVHARLRRRCVDLGRLGDRPARRRRRAGRGRAPRGARPARPRADHRRRAGPGAGADRDRGAGRPPAGRGAGRPPVDVRDPVRRPGPDQPDAAALPGGHRGADPQAAAARSSGPTTGSS